MPPNKAEVQVSKSPAEFFAENQAIAGFDNMGKSLYTTIRELVENSLDACESVGVLPSISVQIEEMNQQEFNVVRGLSSPSKKNGEITRRDVGLFMRKGQKESSPTALSFDAGMHSDTKEENPSAKKKVKRRRDTEAYFRVIVRDNGCGMMHDAIPDLLGRVLSGSKYGVRQTRGKFGLGAKMALIWSKKSTGVPIRVKTSHSTTAGVIGHHISSCVLDIDIYNNRPRIIEHSKKPNSEEWIGTEFEVLIAGNWTTYKSRILQYLQQLAIITPYAQLAMIYVNQTDSKKDMRVRYDRRSEKMPPLAKEVKHHPSSVNNLLIQQLLERSTCPTLEKFLCTDLSSVSATLATRLVAELGPKFSTNMAPSDVNDKQITKLVQLLRSVELFKPPDGSCLSPLGEYNLNLGIRKVLEPDIVATARDKASAYEGHPFIVEAAVSLGGKDVKEGITVVRFANRIPLLFEGGADVATRVAHSKIRWSQYKIDHKRDKIGVFVSIVSTKVPFKGTGKEYIGDDITEIQLSVKRALQVCCQQLRSHLVKKYALKDVKERKSRLTKYVPDVTRSLYGLVEQMRKRAAEEEEEAGSVHRSKKQHTVALVDDLSEEQIRAGLLEAIDGGHEIIDHDDSSRKDGREDARIPLSLADLSSVQSQQGQSLYNDFSHPYFIFRSFQRGTVSS